MTPTKAPKDASQFNPPRPRKAREHTDERLILVNFEFRDTQYGPGYSMEVIQESTGEAVRISGRHTYVMDFLHKIDATEDLPMQFRFVKLGNAFVIKGWDQPDNEES